MHKEISALYAAAMGEEPWEDALDAARTYMSADLLMLSSGTLGTASHGEAWVSGEDTDRLAEAGYTDADRWNPEINPGVSTVETMLVGKTFDCRTLVPEEVFAGSDFLQSTVIKHGLAAGRAYVCSRTPSLAAGGFVAKRGNRDFDDTEAERCNSLVPHIGRALRIRRALGRHRAIEQSLSGIMNQLDVAVFLVDADLRVLFANARAERVARRNDGLSLIRGRLTLPLAAEVAALRVIADFDRPDERRHSSARVPIRKRADAPAYLLRLYPGTGCADLPGAGKAVALILVERLGDGPRLPDLAELQASFGLTEREAAVAQLVPTGKARREIGRALGVSENTVKTHLGAILEKTRARNMRELVFLLTAFGAR